MKSCSKPYTEELIRKSYELKPKDKVVVKATAKSDSLFKMNPKIPKSGTSLYDGFYIRKMDKTEYIYHVESRLFVAIMNKHCKKPMEARIFIDERYDEIMEKIKEVTDVEDTKDGKGSYHTERLF